MANGDKSLPEDDAIAAAHPLRTGRHDLYEKAHRLVSAKHSKGALVDLVNWLLHRQDLVDPNSATGELEVIVAKNRQGRTGTAKVRADMATNSFTDIETDQPEMF